MARPPSPGSRLPMRGSCLLLASLCNPSYGWCVRLLQGLVLLYSVICMMRPHSSGSSILVPSCFRLLKGLSGSRGLARPCLSFFPPFAPHVMLCLCWLVRPPFRDLVSSCLPLPCPSLSPSLSLFMFPFVGGGLAFCIFLRTVYRWRLNAFSRV